MVEIVYATIKRHLMAHKVEGWVWIGSDWIGLDWLGVFKMQTALSNY